MMLREKIGDEKLAEYVEDFRRMAQADPDAVRQKLYSQPHPYNWMTPHGVDRLRVARDMGDDPAAAYREDTGWRGARSGEAVGEGRTAFHCRRGRRDAAVAGHRAQRRRTPRRWSVDAAEPSLDDVLSPVQNRKKTNGSRACAVLNVPAQ